MLTLRFLVIQSAGNCSEWAENKPDCFCLKCMNFHLNAEIFTCALLLPLQYLSLSFSKPDLSKTPSALSRKTESYSGGARHG